MPWDDAKTERLKVLWPLGLSASQIAADIGGVTRNAVIGKRIRLGLPDRAPRRSNGMTKAARERQRQQKPKRGHLQYGSPAAQLAPEPFRPAPDLDIPPAERRRLQDLEAGDCRWGIGDPRLPDFYFCGRLQLGTETRGRRGISSYCDFHARRAYDAPRVRRISADATTALPAPCGEREKATSHG